MSANRRVIGLALTWLVSLLCVVITVVQAADPEMDKRLRELPGKDWLTNVEK
jgi:hypothetical protein